MVKLPKGPPTSVQPQRVNPVELPPYGCPDALLQVSVTPDVPLDVGSLVSAQQVVDRLRLLSQGQIVAWVATEAHPAIAQCLELGVRYEGAVMSMHDGTAEIRLEAVG